MTPYNPDTSTLSAKIGRHLRRKGWKQSRKSGLWVDPINLTECAISRAIATQIGREK